ncbi:hypothetical protein Tco_0184731 [Tanacetum coccineum]
MSYRHAKLTPRLLSDARTLLPQPGHRYSQFLLPSVQHLTEAHKILLDKIGVILGGAALRGYEMLYRDQVTNIYNLNGEHGVDDDDYGCGEIEGLGGSLSLVEKSVDQITTDGQSGGATSIDFVTRITYRVDSMVVLDNLCSIIGCLFKTRRFYRAHQGEDRIKAGLYVKVVMVSDHTSRLTGRVTKESFTGGGYLYEWDRVLEVFTHHIVERNDWGVGDVRYQDGEVDTVYEVVLSLRTVWVRFYHRLGTSGESISRVNAMGGYLVSFCGCGGKLKSLATLCEGRRDLVITQQSYLQGVGLTVMDYVCGWVVLGDEHLDRDAAWRT